MRVEALYSLVHIVICRNFIVVCQTVVTYYEDTCTPTPLVDLLCRTYLTSCWKTIYTGLGSQPYLLKEIP